MLAGEKLKKAVESVIRDMNVRPPGIVDLQCTEEHLRDLSRDVHDWKNIIGYLGFEKTRRVQAEIISDCRGLLEQTTEMFLRWRDRHGVNATYRKLIEVFVGKVQNRVYAERLCEIVCVSPPEGWRKIGLSSDHSFTLIIIVISMGWSYMRPGKF